MAEKTNAVISNMVNLFRRDPVMPAAGLLAALSMLLVSPDARYLDYLDAKVLICLFALMLSVELFQEASLLAAAACRLVSRVGGLKRLTLLLCGLTFFLAMFLTNDVALITLVPLSMAVFRLVDDSGGLIRAIVLQTVAANAGSALTPIGNPQNLYLFTHYRMTGGAFFIAVLPVGLAGAVLLVILISRIRDQSLRATVQPVRIAKGLTLALGGLIFLAAVGCVFGAWSEWILLGTALALALLRPKALLRVDYGLLLTFVFFFILVGNLSRVDAVRNMAAAALEGPHRVMLAGSLLSQAISNVPAAILLSGFTDKAGQLLRGVNVGGFGTLIASLASVISYKIYCRGTPGNGAGKRRFLLIFTGYNVMFLVIMLAVALVFPY
jgi:Na+/H+ antiporter NhaD/arsenite permease-like protein